VTELGDAGRRRVSEVSLVIPVRDEAHSVGALITSIQGQTRRPDEVIIVDGGSTDGTLDRVRALAGKDPTLQIVEAGDATPGRARNVGRSVARNPWIAFTDAGIQLDSGWLEQLILAAERDPAAEVVFGSYEPQIRSFLDSCAVGAYVPACHATPSGWFRGPSTASLMIRRDTFDGVHGFPDLRAAEDLVFFERLSRGRVPVTCAPSAVVYWETPPSVSATYRRFRQYSRQNVLLGRQQYWHYGVARLYVAAAAALCVALAWDRRALRLLPLGPLIRAWHNLWPHRREFGLAFILNPMRIAGVAGLTLLVDAATLRGWASASFRLLRRWPYGTRGPGLGGIPSADPEAPL
jgi:glycosyltransferase involved in cell wall biosynthesis